ncbi:MAG: alpha/beta fold hydrolase [Bacillota bacterium]
MINFQRKFFQSSKIYTQLIIILFFFLILFSANLALAEIDKKPYVNSEFIIIDDIKFHYRVFQKNADNAKAKILLVHGMGGSTYCWRNNSEFLSKIGYQVVAVDLPGFGYTERKKGLVHSSQNRAKWLNSLIDYLDEEKFNDSNPWFLAGHSMGAKPISQMALDNPERFKGLIYVGGAVYNSPPQIRGKIIGNWPFRAITKFILNTFVIKRDRIENILNSAYGEEISEKVIEAYLKTMQIEGTTDVWLDLVKSSSPALGNISNIKLPVLLIWGEDDSWVSLEEGERLKEELENAKLKIIKDSHHMVMATDYKEVNEKLISFIEKVGNNEKTH